MLQRGRAHLSAEIPPIEQLVCSLSGASTGPRSLERGRGHHCRRCTGSRGLQRGRAHLSAESRVARAGGTTCSHMLQRGRAHLSAESPRAGAGQRLSRASTGPRSLERGDIPAFLDNVAGSRSRFNGAALLRARKWGLVLPSDSRIARASTGPRYLSAENSAGQFYDAAASKRFNGAALN